MDKSLPTEFYFKRIVTELNLKSLVLPIRNAHSVLKMLTRGLAVVHFPIATNDVVCICFYLLSDIYFEFVSVYFLKGSCRTASDFKHSSANNV